MPEYQFANRDGSIVTEDYDRNTYFSAKQVLKSLKDAFQLFPYTVEINQVDNFEDILHIRMEMDSETFIFAEKGLLLEDDRVSKTSKEFSLKPST